MTRGGDPSYWAVHPKNAEMMMKERTMIPAHRLFDLHDEADFRWLADYFSGYHGVPGLRAATFPDEERLARALDGYDEGVMQDKAELWARGKRGTDWFAAAIAKAYREDTDAD